MCIRDRNNVIRIETSQRSSILSARDDMANTVRSAFQLAGANVTFGEGYPGWKPNPHSAILEAVSYTHLIFSNRRSENNPSIPIIKQKQHGKKRLKAGWRIQVFRRNLPSATPFEEGRRCV